jgi:hypothetical protein
MTTLAATTQAPSPTTSRAAVWTGRVLSGIAVLFLIFDASLKVLMVGPAVTGTVEIGYPVHVIRPLGIIQVICLALYLWPRSAVVGAVLWTGYLGGAIATHLRLGHPLLSHTLFPIYVAVLLWGGLWLRQKNLRALFNR